MWGQREWVAASWAAWRACARPTSWAAQAARAAAAGVSGDVIARSHKALTEVLARDAVKKQLENIGAEAALSSPEEFGKLIADEVTRWRAVAKSAGLEPQ